MHHPARQGPVAVLYLKLSMGGDGFRDRLDYKYVSGRRTYNKGTLRTTTSEQSRKRSYLKYEVGGLKAYFWWIESVLASHGPYL
jgi:hypothetical protein